METIDILIRNIKLLMRHMSIKSQTELSEKMAEKGIVYSQSNLSRLFSKKHKNIELDSLLMLAKFFHVTVGQLLGSEPITDQEYVQDELKRQLNVEFYDKMGDEARHALVAHANLLFSMENSTISAATPFTLNYSASKVKRPAGNNSQTMSAEEINNAEPSKGSDMYKSKRSKIS